MGKSGDQAEQDHYDYTMGTGAYGTVKRSDDQFNKNLFKKGKNQQQKRNQQQAMAKPQEKKSTVLGTIIGWIIILIFIALIFSK